MGEDTGSQDTREDVTPRTRADWKQSASTGILLVAVVAILATGALLRAERTVDAAVPARDDTPAAAPAAPSAPRSGSVAVSEDALEPLAERPKRPAAAPAAAPLPPRPQAAPASPAGSDLGQRSTRDLLRLSRSRGSFTSQVAVTCKPDNTRRILKKAGGSEQLFLIPLPARGPTCFRVCWGLYPSADEAAAAHDLPAFLRQAGGRPSAKPVAEIAP